MTKKQVVPKGYRVNPRGQLIEEAIIQEVDLLRDDLVVDLVAQAEHASQVLASLKARIFSDVQAFLDLSAQKYGVVLGGEKGGVVLSSYDGEYRVEVSVADRIDFDERLKAAKALIDRFLARRTEDIGDIRPMILDAFDVGKSGKINAHKILSLRKYKIDDEDWIMAMDAIADSVKIVGARQYARVYTGGTGQGKKAIPLDLASV